MNFLSCYLFVLIFLNQIALATTTAMNAQLADQSKQFSLGVNHIFVDEESEFINGLSLDFSRLSYQTSFNSNTDDFIIEKNSMSLGIESEWNKTVLASIEAASASVNSKEATILGFKSKVGFRYKDFTMKLGLYDSYLRQQSDFKILNNNVTDQLTFKNQRQSIYLSYSGVSDLLVSFSYDKYNYDRDVQSLNTILSVRNVLVQNGAAFLSQINSLIDYELSIDLSYAISSDLDLEATISKSIDYLDSSIESRGVRMGVTYYFEQVDLGIGYSSIKTLDTQDSSASVDLTLSYNF